MSSEAAAGSSDDRFFVLRFGFHARRRLEDEEDEDFLGAETWNMVCAVGWRGWLV